MRNFVFFEVSVILMINEIKQIIYVFRLQIIDHIVLIYNYISSSESKFNNSLNRKIVIMDYMNMRVLENISYHKFDLYKIS